MVVVACGGTDTPADTTPAAAGDDDASTNSHDGSASANGDGSVSGGGDGSASSGDGASAADGSGTPTADGGDDIACAGVASCGAGEACIADYPTAEVATDWCRFAGVAKRVTEFSGLCSGYHVVEIATGVVGALTLDYYDPTSGALVAIVHQSLNTQKSCTGSPAEVSSSPCGDSAGVTTVLADSCTD